MLAQFGEGRIAWQTGTRNPAVEESSASALRTEEPENRRTSD